MSHLMVFFFMFRVPRERKKDKKQEDLSEDQPCLMARCCREGAWPPGHRAKETGRGKATDEGPCLSKTGPRKSAKGKSSPGLQAQSLCICGHPPGYEMGSRSWSLLERRQS